MQRVNETFYSLLKEWMPEGVAVYPSIAEESARYPYCVFNMASFTTKRVKEGIVGYNFAYEVNVWGCAFNQVDRVVTRIASAAEQAEEVRFDDPDGKMRVTLMDGTADYGEGEFVQSLRFEIKYDGSSV